MRKILYCASAVCVLFFSWTSALGYLGNSTRIMGMGNYLAGVVADEYTDIYRNPAYLSFADKV